MPDSAKLVNMPTVDPIDALGKQLARVEATANRTELGLNTLLAHFSLEPTSMEGAGSEDDAEDGAEDEAEDDAGHEIGGTDPDA